MTNENQGVQDALDAQRAIALLASPPTVVDIARVDRKGNRCELTNFRAEYSDGSVVHAPRIVVDLS